MAVVAVAIVISFHLKSEPSKLEIRFSLPFGIIFWLLSLACLLSGLANYCKTVVRYGKRSAIVQSGWKTEVVRWSEISATRACINCAKGIYCRCHGNCSSLYLTSFHQFKIVGVSAWSLHVHSYTAICLLIRHHDGPCVIIHCREQQPSINELCASPMTGIEFHVQTSRNFCLVASFIPIRSI
jgi:hypothetical protein